jgi:predicted nuclease with TOPRIM domain
MMDLEERLENAKDDLEPLRAEYFDLADQLCELARRFSTLDTQFDEVYGEIDDVYSEASPKLRNEIDSYVYNQATIFRENPSAVANRLDELCNTLQAGHLVDGS